MNKAIHLFLLLLIVPAFAAAQLPEGWEWQNPRPHGMTVYDIKMLSPTVVIAACENGYVMRSEDGGRTWREIRIAGGHVYSLSASGAGNIWAAAGDGGVLRSTDRGYTWEVQIAPGADLSGFADIHMYDDSRGMAILPRNNIYRTTDGGENWEQIPDPYFGQDYGRWVSAQSESKWFVMGIVGVAPRLYITTDFGNSWTTAKENEFNTRGLNNLVFVDTQHGFQCRNGELLRTSNGGLSWEELDIYGFGNVTDIEAGPHLGDRLFALSEGSVVVNASYDDGASWAVSLLENAFDYATPMAIDFATPETGIVAGSGGRILRTSDGGQSWNIVHGIGFLGHIIDIAFTTPTQGMALTTSHTVLLTSDGGDRWVETVPFEGVSLQKVSMYSTTGGFAYGTEGGEVYHAFHTSDAGETWERRGLLYENTTQGYVVPQAMVSDSPSRMFAGIAYGRLMRSTDGGMTFDSLALPSVLRQQYYSSMELFLFPPDHLTMVASNGVAHSTDAGDTWTFHNVWGGQWLRAAVFVDPLLGFAIQGRRFSYTTNGGADWEITDNSDNELIHFFNAADGVMYSSVFQDDDNTGSIKRTRNGGQTWTEHTLKESVGWNEWFWQSQTDGWAYGYGGMIRHSGSSGVVGAPAVQTIPASFTLDDAFPNPISLGRHSALSVTVSVGGGGARDVVIAIRDVLGRAVVPSVTRTLAPGKHIIAIPAESLSNVQGGSAVFVVVTNGDRRVTRKVAVMP